MSGRLDIGPSATTYDLEDLVGLAWEGAIRVPHFQRDFRWTRQDVARLFDSIVKGYPVGSLLLWRRRAPADEIRLGALTIKAPRMDRALWVVDGQQRVTSLANALSERGSRDPRFSLAYDLETEQFVPVANEDEPWVVPLPILFDLQRLLRWAADYREVATYLDRATAVTKSLRQFKVPAYVVERGDETILRDIFDRMNNYGKRLSRAEIFSALYAESEEQSKDSLTIPLIAEHIDAEFGFGRVDADTVLRAILARRGPDVTREIRIEFDYAERRGTIEFEGESRNEAYGAGEDAIRRAVSFLQETVGVPHFAFLPYRYLLVVLTRLFAHHPKPDPRNLQLLRRWYWRAAVVGLDFLRGGSSTEAMRLLCSKVQPGSLSSSVQGLLEVLERSAPVLPDLSAFRTNTAATKITLCAWWSKAPRSPLSGLPYEREQLSQLLSEGGTAAEAVRHVIRYRALPSKYRKWAANRVLMPSATEPASEIDALFLQKAPGISDSNWTLVLRSHCMDESIIDLLGEGENDSFLERRQAVLRDDLVAFLENRCEWGFENTPPLNELILDDEEESEDDADPI